MMFNKVKPYIAVILIQVGFAGLALLSKIALNNGLNHYVFVVYRHAFATAVIAPLALFLERNRPQMTFRIFVKILLLGLLEPVIDQNLYYGGMKYTTAAITTALCNIVPAMTFLLAWVFKLERVHFWRSHSQVKILGTVVSFGGALILAIVKGPSIVVNHHQSSAVADDVPVTSQQRSMGFLMITLGCVCWAGFVILQAVTLKSYPAEMSLTAFICLAGAVEGAVVALIAERGNAAVWAIHLDTKFLAALYGGVICSSFAYYMQGMVIKWKGPVFATSFSPLGMIIVTIVGLIFLHDELLLGRLIGSLVIVSGLYMVLWGKSKEQSKKQVDDNQDLPTDQPMQTINSNDNMDGSSHSARVAPTDENV